MPTFFIHYRRIIPKRKAIVAATAPEARRLFEAEEQACQKRDPKRRITREVVWVEDQTAGMKSDAMGRPSRS